MKRTKFSGQRISGAATKKMKKLVRSHLMVVKGYSLEAGIRPEDYEMVFTVEFVPRVAIVPKTRTNAPLLSLAVAMLSMDEAMALAAKGLQASLLIGALTGQPVTRADISQYAKP
jgi:hypothetical protein